MFLIKIYRYILGYVEIIVSGEFCEKILNLLAIYRVSVWDINRGKNEIRLKLYIHDFKNLRKIRGKSRLHIKINKKFGVVFILKKYFKRIGIPVGILLFFTIIYVLSLFVWNVTVVGNTKVSTAVIEKYCSELGVKNGVLLSKINSQLLREELLLRCDGLSWCSFNIEGSKITVNVSEISENSDQNAPSNIVSEYDCVISDIFVQSGVANVIKGQAVSKGELLVSGISDINSVNKFVKSRANITAEIQETVTVSGNFSGEKNEPTGEIIKKSVFEFFGLKIPLYLGQVNSDYKEELYVKKLKFFGEKIPISVYSKTFKLERDEPFNYSREELLSNLTNEMKDKIAQITDKYEVISRNIEESENELKIKYDIKYSKNIGIEEKLIFNVSK